MTCIVTGKRDAKLDVIPEEGSTVAAPPPSAGDEKGEEPGKVEPQEEQETEEPIVSISTEVVVREEAEKDMDLAQVGQVEQGGEEPGEQVMISETRIGSYTMIHINFTHKIFVLEIFM